LENVDTLWLNYWLISSGTIRGGDAGEDILDGARDSAFGIVFIVPQAIPDSELRRGIMKFFAIGLIGA